MTEREIRRAFDIMCKCPNDTRELAMKVAAAKEAEQKPKALERYKKETDPCLKNQMKYFIEMGNYDFDYLFG